MSRIKRAVKALGPCVLALASCISTSKIVHASDEFNGKLGGWMDVTQAPYNANGSDNNDDTSAIQSALNLLGSAGHHSLYIPNGTYYISSTLTMNAKSGISILGQSRDGVKIVWRGAPGGTMMESQGNWFARYGRITWDGQDGGGNRAGTIWWDWNKGERNGGEKAPGAGFAPQHNEHADEVFQDADYGIRAGGKDVDTSYNQMDAETPVLRCKFKNLSIGGLSIEDPNALDWWVWYGEFTNCAKGVANDANPASGGGNFHVYYSKFTNSTIADISVNNAGYFGLRGNYSTGSAKFIMTDHQGPNRVSFWLQGNSVVDSTTQPCIKLQNSGPLTMIDNKFRALNGVTSTPMIEVGDGWPPPAGPTANGTGPE